MSGPRGWAGARGAALAGAGALLLLLVPIEMVPSGIWGAAAGDAAHVVLFAGLAWVWGRSLPARWRGWPLWLGLVCLAGAVELLQGYTGREQEWTDWLLGAGGAALVCGTWRWSQSGWRVALVLLLAALPLGWATCCLTMEMRAFPVMAEPGSRWAEQGWEQRGGKLSRDGGVFRFSAKKIGEPDSYPGVFREPAVRDWREADGFSFAIYWPEERLAVFGIRVDDSRKQPVYAERFQKELNVTQGWNQILISRQELARTSGGRPMRLDHVTRWGVFLVTAETFDYFLLSEVRLGQPEKD